MTIITDSSNTISLEYCFFFCQCYLQMFPEADGNFSQNSISMRYCFWKATLSSYFLTYLWYASLLWVIFRPISPHFVKYLANTTLDALPSKSRRTADVDPASWHMQFSDSGPIGGTISIFRPSSSLLKSILTSPAIGTLLLCYQGSYSAVTSLFYSLSSPSFWWLKWKD